MIPDRTDPEPDIGAARPVRSPSHRPGSGDNSPGSTEDTPGQPQKDSPRSPVAHTRPAVHTPPRRHATHGMQNQLPHPPGDKAV